MAGTGLRLMALALLALPALTWAQDSYRNFESVPVRPIALSPDGNTLFVTNTPDNRLEIFDVTASGLVHRTAVPVGLEPVAVAARTDSEVWVVCHLSDSVNVVDVAADPPRVVRTLLVGDEPSDIVFGGTPASEGAPFPRAFVSAARRGQNHPGNPKADLRTPGVGLADVWVFDATALPAGLTSAHETIVQMFGDKPRALAVSADGSEVYAGVFHSGNGSTSLLEAVVCDGGAGAGPCGQPNGFTSPGGLPAPNVDSGGNPQPEVGLIVKFDPPSGEWRDAVGRDWSDMVPFSLPDNDVFAINATANPPVQSGSVARVGTVLFGMAAHPGGDVFVANTDANNLERFEGPGTFSTSLRGHLHEARIAIVDPVGSTSVSRHLNKHINYGPGPVSFNGGGDKDDSLATPVGLAFSADGSELFVAAFGSSKIGVFNVATLSDDSFTPDSGSHIAVSGGGPAGMAVDAGHDRLYVYTRFDNAVKEIDLGSDTEVASHALHDVEPPVVTDGRSFLYDAHFTSSNGEASCAGCHVFGDKDDLAFDLGNPDGLEVPNPNPFVIPQLSPPDPVFHPVKGPMTVQTLRGMFPNGPMHWRGDRTGGPGGDPLDEVLAFEAFNVAFDGLLGRDAGPIPGGDMNAFAQFALTLSLQPNPHRNLDNSLEPNEQLGRDSFLNVPTDAGLLQCEFCHTLEPQNGFFGTSGASTLEGETQEFKVPHLRNEYDKHGMWGTPVGLLPPNFFGNQVRGFGVLHDGAIANVVDFVNADPPFMNFTAAERNGVIDFMFVFDTNLAPSVGQQVTLTPTSGVDVGARIDLLRQSAMDSFDMFDVPGATECELTVKGVIGGEPRGWVMNSPAGNYTDDHGDTIADGALRALAATPGQELTFTCVYPPGGERIGVDRDQDGISDGDQCGDSNGDGIVTETDPHLDRKMLAGAGSVPFIDKCNVIGASGGGVGSCQINDVAAKLRALAGQGPGLAQVCAAAL